MTKELYCSNDYLVTDDGRIISKISMKALKNSITRKGYELTHVRINGKQKSIQVHRAVAIAFVDGYADGLVVNHKDGNKLNNNASNLEWVTPKENARHSVDVLGNGVGVKNHNSRKIVCVDKSGSEVKRYNSITDAAMEIDSEKYIGKKMSIWKALNGALKTYRGFVWKYID